MTFFEHLQSRVLEPRLKESRILVVFDPDGRYEDLCMGFSDSNRTILNTTRKPLSTRLDAMQAWKHLCADTTHASQLLIYSRDPVPLTEEEQRSNPYSAYVAMGGRFPDGPNDDYEQLCLAFLPDRRTELGQLFAGDALPEFQHIDSLAGGANSHPRLEAIFNTGEATKIVTSFLAPSDVVEKELDASTEWCGELRQLVERVFGFKLNAKVTKADTIRAKLWQFLLFSEFAADLPSTLPAGLADLPRATGTAGTIVMDLCESLRSSDFTRDAYRDAANEIEKELDLVEECQSLSDLGDRDTFAFEESRFLQFAVTCIKAKDLDRAHEILETHHRSLWTEEGERQLLWRILRLSLELLGAIRIGEEELKHVGAHGLDLASAYSDKLARVDLHQRELDTAVLQLDEGFDEVEAIIQIAHTQYRAFANSLQDVFLPAVAREGWPFAGMAASRDTYRDSVAPLLNEGKRVAYFLTDALRLELAQKLAENLSKQYATKVSPVCAQLPCVTRFGMASLLPDAGDDLRFNKYNEELEPFLDGEAVGTRSNRLKAFSKHQGDRVRTFAIGNFIDETKTPARRDDLKQKLAETDLLVITSTELDSLGEGEEWLRQHLSEPLDKLLRAIRRSAELGFEIAIVATDHGFLWVDEVDSGTSCQKPIGGEWPVKKRRCFIGKGDEPAGSMKFSTAAVGIPCEEPAFVVPRSIGVYGKGSSYYHEGLSLQESLVGRMYIKLSEDGSAVALEPEKANLELSRKRSKVSSLIVSINLSWPGGSSLFAEESKEFDLIAFQGKDKEVGRPTASEKVDPVTNRIRIAPGEAIKVNLRLTGEVEEGAFRIKVLDIKTEKALDTLELTYSPNVL
ncbi:PglZ domain-containing protein [Verrucomicrobiales bacterium]|nr:PglZ domain-containing protein [Verrucomicrobiales bacterium]